MIKRAYRRWRNSWEWASEGQIEWFKRNKDNLHDYFSLSLIALSFYWLFIH